MPWRFDVGLRDNHMKNDDLIGYWKITKMDVWSQAYVDLVVPGFIEHSYENIERFLQPLHAAGVTPIALGGDHSIAIGTFSAISSFFKEQGNEIGLIWFDAHADIDW